MILHQAYKKYLQTHITKAFRRPVIYRLSSKLVCTSTCMCESNLFLITCYCCYTLCMYWTINVSTLTLNWLKRIALKKTHTVMFVWRGLENRIPCNRTAGLMRFAIRLVLWWWEYELNLLSFLCGMLDATFCTQLEMCSFRSEIFICLCTRMKLFWQYFTFEIWYICVCIACLLIYKWHWMCGALY